jgi:hypothetical protein
MERNVPSIETFRTSTNGVQKVKTVMNGVQKDCLCEISFETCQSMKKRSTRELRLEARNRKRKLLDQVGALKKKHKNSELPLPIIWDENEENAIMILLDLYLLPTVLGFLVSDYLREMGMTYGFSLNPMSQPFIRFNAFYQHLQSCFALLMGRNSKFTGFKWIIKPHDMQQTVISWKKTGFRRPTKFHYSLDYPSLDIRGNSDGKLISEGQSFWIETADLRSYWSPNAVAFTISKSAAFSSPIDYYFEGWVKEFHAFLFDNYKSRVNVQISFSFF